MSLEGQWWFGGEPQIWFWIHMWPERDCKLLYGQVCLTVQGRVTYTGFHFCGREFGVTTQHRDKIIIESLNICFLSLLMHRVLHFRTKVSENCRLFILQIQKSSALVNFKTSNSGFCSLIRSFISIRSVSALFG